MTVPLLIRNRRVLPMTANDRSDRCAVVFNSVTRNYRPPQTFSFGSSNQTDLI